MSVVRIDLEIQDKNTGAVTQRVGAQLKDLGSSGVKAGAAIGAGFGLASKAIEIALDLLRSIPAEIGRVVASASALSDMAAKTQMTTESLQRLKYAGALVGVTLDDIASAALKAQRNLIENPKAFEKWGLSAKALRDLRPEDQLAAIADVIRKIPEPARQVAAAMDLMGKGGAANMALLRSDLHQVFAEADNLGVAMGDELVGKLDDVDDATTRLSASWTALKDKIIGGVVAATGADQVMNDLATAIGAVNTKAQGGIGSDGPLALWVAMVSKLTGLGQLKDMIAVMSLMNVGNPAVKGKGLDTSADQIDFDRILKDAVRLTEALAKADDKAATAAKRHAEQQRKLAEALQAKELKQYTLDIQAEFDRLLKIEQETAEQQDRNTDAFIADVKREHDEYQKWVDERKKGEQEVAEAWEAMQRRMHEEAIAGLRALADAFADVGGGLGNFLSGALTVLANLNDEAVRGASAWQKMAVSIHAAVAAYNSKSPGKGAASGAAAGAQYGPVGAVAGAVAGWMIGAFAQGKAANAELKKMRDELALVQAAAAKVGVAFNENFSTKGAKDKLQAIRDEIDKINKALDTQAEAQEKVQEALGRYNFTLAEQGPILAALDLDKKFGQIYQDWQLLIAAGVDHNAVMRELGPSVGTFVDAAKAAGTEIPIAMKPIIDDLFLHGKLLHENGEAYTQAEVDGLSYAQTMSQMFEELIGKVTDLVNALLGIPNVTRTVTVNTVKTGAAVGGAGDPGEPPAPRGRRGLAVGFGAGGVGSWRNGPGVIHQDMIAQLHKNEAVWVVPAAAAVGMGFMSAARGFGDEGGRERVGIGMVGVTDSSFTSGTAASTSFGGGSTGSSIGALTEAVSQLVSETRALAQAPTSITVPVTANQNVTFNDATRTPEAVRALTEVIPQVLRGLRNNTGGLKTQVKGVVEDTLRTRGLI